jgi:hypothetical protein
VGGRGEYLVLAGLLAEAAQVAGRIAKTFPEPPDQEKRHDDD